MAVRPLPGRRRDAGARLAHDAGRAGGRRGGAHPLQVGPGFRQGPGGTDRPAPAPGIGRYPVGAPRRFPAGIIRSMGQSQPTEKVAVALSGGIDSAVSAPLLLRERRAVSALFAKSWEDDACPAREDFAVAAAVAERLGIDTDLVDLTEAYRSQVFARFVREYEGAHPQPGRVVQRARQVRRPRPARARRRPRRAGGRALRPGRAPPGRAAGPAQGGGSPQGPKPLPLPAGPGAAVARSSRSAR